MGTSGHERLAVDDLNSTDVAGERGERAGHLRELLARKLLRSQVKKQREGQTTHTTSSVAKKRWQRKQL